MHHIQRYLRHAATLEQFNLGSLQTSVIYLQTIDSGEYVQFH